MPIEIIHLGERISLIIKQKGLKVRHVAHDANLDVENLRTYLGSAEKHKIDEYEVIKFDYLHSSAWFSRRLIK